MSLKYSILALLARDEKTGYELANDADGSTRFFWAATHQQIYKDLSGLEQKGWVRHKEIGQSNKPDKKIYSITKEGLRQLKAWMASETEPQPNKDALLIKLFVGDLIDPNIIHQDLIRHKTVHQENLGRYLEIEEKYFQNPKRLPIKMQFQYITLRKGILFEKGWLAWCKETEILLQNHSGEKCPI